MADIIRQGDLILRRVEDLHELRALGWWIYSDPLRGYEARRVEHPLLHGEVTGHAHVLRASRAAIEDYNGRGVIRIESDDARIMHPEHRTVTIPAGMWMWYRQQEYDPWEGTRNIAD